MSKKYNKLIRNIHNDVPKANTSFWTKTRYLYHIEQYVRVRLKTASIASQYCRVYRERRIPRRFTFAFAERLMAIWTGQMKLDFSPLNGDERHRFLSKLLIITWKRKPRKTSYAFNKSIRGRSV